ncbi:MAG: hypothetical protein PGN25_15065 [Methylorubrum populi]
MIARILSPFLRWLDRRIDTRIADHLCLRHSSGSIHLSPEQRQALEEISRRFSESFDLLAVAPVPGVQT